MKKKSFAIWIAVIWVVLSLLAVGGVTYAWFTFRPDTNVEPMSSTISDGEVALLISPSLDTDFLTSCALPNYSSGSLEPVSTANLESFYSANLQTRQGISVGFRECQEEDLNTYAIRGRVYLKSLKDGCQVYFNRAGMGFGDDPQMLAALRLGLKITSSEGEQTFIFHLNDMGDVSSAVSMQTTAQEHVVVGSLAENGNPNYVNDPAIGLSDYFAVVGAQRLPQAGRASLCIIDANEIVSVEYWLYLEGCDEQCINAVQEKEAFIQLSFAGVTK
ncbi:MAG: hypothetical protein E7295_14200 [Lachnospiraceae bacterium]|jgi:hypothetical protein|nr:hypothetical protein [Lachnospiraceae bacterium]